MIKRGNPFDVETVISIIYPLRDKFLIGNIEVYLQFISFLHSDLRQVVEILPRVRQELNYSA